MSPLRLCCSAPPPDHADGCARHWLGSVPPGDPYAARCRALAAHPHHAPYREAFLGAARSIEGGGVSGPIALLAALVEAGVDPEDAGVPVGPVEHAR